MIEELYLYKLIDGVKTDYTLVDIDKVDIVRKYTTPFFQDVTSLKNDSTYTIKLPKTIKNKSFFEFCDRFDTSSTIQYDYLYADYFYKGLNVFLDAEVKILDTVSFYEIQCVYGINRRKYLPLFENKLNEIVPNGTTILESDWVINWTKNSVIYATGKKYKYIDYISGNRTSDIEFINGVLVGKLTPPEPIYSNMKPMTMHPFILSENILNLIKKAYLQTVGSFTSNTSIGLYTIIFTETISDKLSVGDIVTKINTTSTNNIILEIVNDTTIRLNNGIFPYFTDGCEIEISYSDRHLDVLNEKLTNKGLILNREDGSIELQLNQIQLYNQTGDIQGNTGIQIMQPNGESDWVDGYNILVNTYFGLYIPAGFKFSNGISESAYPITVKIKINAYIKSPRIRVVLDPIEGFGHEELLVIPATTSWNYGYYDYDNVEATFEISKEHINYTFFLMYDDLWETAVIEPIYNSVASERVIDISLIFNGAFYNGEGEYESVANDMGRSILKTGYYDCIKNLPKITPIEFIQQMLIVSCAFVNYDNDGNLKVYFLDDFKSNLESGNVYDWSNKISVIRKSSFQFNSNAQKNYIKFSNDNELINRNEYVSVLDNTIDIEKDLYTLLFQSPVGNENEKSEYILYEQTVKRNGDNGVTFENKYTGKSLQCAFVKDDNGVAKNTNIIDDNYTIYQKIVERPTVVECDVNLTVNESATIDFTKPVYIDQIGRYAMLLELQATNNELCAAKLLIINQEL